MIIEVATKAFEEIRDTRHGDLRHDLIRAAASYAQHRAEWYLAATEERGCMGQARTVAHNAFIDCCNILSRQMAKSGESTGWRGMLGVDRREIGDFACYVALFVGLAAH
jgi:hypothetical protein